MSLSFRKSIKVGPMRFNFSKSGLGVSTGFKGFRIGSGPRGNYVSVSAHGIRFRQSLGGQRPTNGFSGREEPVSIREQPSAKAPAVDTMQEIESGDVLSMGDSSATELLSELNEKRKKPRMLPYAIAVGIAGLIGLAATAPPWLLPIWLVLWLFFGMFVRTKDILKKSTVIFYELSPEANSAYKRLLDWFDDMCNRQRIWHVLAEGDVFDRKYQAGADRVLQRNRIFPNKTQMEHLKTNIDYPVIPVGRQKLALMPERILVFDTQGVGAVSYQDLNLEVTESHFIEEESLPSDAEVIGSTWKYVNKKGGRDRRFNDNYEIPIARYETIHFRSQSGLNELIKLSRPGAGEPLSQCFTSLARITSGNP